MHIKKYFLGLGLFIQLEEYLPSMHTSSALNKPGMVTHVCNPGIQGGDTVGILCSLSPSPTPSPPLGLLADPLWF